MAVARIPNGYTLGAAADTITERIRVRKILVTQTGGAAGPITLRQDGASGTILFDGDTILGDTINIADFSGPVGHPITGFYVSAIPASAQVIVLVD